MVTKQIESDNKKYKDKLKRIQVGKTRVIKKSLNPTWNESFVANVDAKNFKALEFELWDKDAIGSDFMGVVRVEGELSDPLRPFASDAWHKLCESPSQKAKLPPTGELKLVLRHKNADEFTVDWSPPNKPEKQLLLCVMRDKLHCFDINSKQLQEAIPLSLYTEAALDDTDARLVFLRTKKDQTKLKFGNPEEATFFATEIVRFSNAQAVGFDSQNVILPTDILASSTLKIRKREVGFLQVTVHSARDVDAKDRGGTSVKQNSFFFNA